MTRNFFYILMVLGLIFNNVKGEDKPATSGIVAGIEIDIKSGDKGELCRGDPHIAFGKDFYIAVWREGWEGRNGGARIRFSRINLEGKFIGDQAIEVSTNLDKDSPQERPRVAFCKNIFLIVWQDFRNGVDYDVLGARIDQDGKVLDSKPIFIAGGLHNQVLPDVAADNDGFMVVWQSFQESEKDHSFHGFAARIDTNGKLSEANETGVSPVPKIAWNGKSFLVASSGVGPFKNSMVLILDSNGKPLSIKTAAISKSEFYSISSVPDKGWLIVTHRSIKDHWGWGGPGAIRCSYINNEGVIEENQPAEIGNPTNKLYPTWLDTNNKDLWPHGPSSSAWDGQHTVVIWQRHHLKNVSFIQCDLMGMQVDGWKRLSDQATTITANDENELNPSLASNGAGQLMCIYEKESNTGTSICVRILISK